ncbi:hypothetical protein [Actinoallomurus rhizosphaericola]|uniref:hypothetical protein n=1 Tax=Actinoallomurus rhizosphaericola TaxID=2952536 RepID=UPI002092A33B|nr:hypothetical protein [Actinoallomurus rhizosphaericola]MCO5996071.1 hypothetical protein [Actinoallomurus rhizosphaericola]
MRRILIICTVAGILASAGACGGSGDSKKNDAKSSLSRPADGAGKTPGGDTASKPAAGGHAVVLEVQGSGELPGILYNTTTSGNASNVKLPWKKTAKVPGGHLLAVLASSTSGNLTCSITVDGKVVTKKTGPVAQCRYQLKK